MELKRVVVTGLGALTPLGHTAPETWENLLKGVSGAGPITHFDASKFKTQFACEVKDFKVTDYIDRKEARKMDLYEQYALVAAMEAVKDCGVDLESVDKNRISVSAVHRLGKKHLLEAGLDATQFSAHKLRHVRVLFLRHNRRTGSKCIRELHKAELPAAPQNDLFGKTG